jgi:competence protein ComGF
MIFFEEETDRYLADLAQLHDGDRGKAVMDLIRTHQLSDEDIDEFERVHHGELVMQLERSDRNFREGNWITRCEVNRRIGL